MILLYFYMAAVAVVLGLAGVMEYQGLKQEVSGANGFIWTMAILLMVLGLFLTSLATWLFFSGKSALATFGIGAAWLALCGFASIALMMAGARKK